MSIVLIFYVVAITMFKKNNKMKKYKLFLDDVRKPSQVYSYIRDSIYNENGWVVVKNYNEFVNAIQKNGLPYFVSFDHDLASEHYSPSMVSTEAYNRLYGGFEEKTGLHCARFLMEYCRENGLQFPNYKVHSMNPAGKYNIESEIIRFTREIE